MRLITAAAGRFRERTATQHGQVGPGHQRAEQRDAELEGRSLQGTGHAGALLTDVTDHQAIRLASMLATQRQRDDLQANRAVPQRHT